MEENRELTIANTGSEYVFKTGVSPTEKQDNVFRRDYKETPQRNKLMKHRLWLDSIQHEYPLPSHPFRIGVYIRYYNQTRHSNYLEKHKQKFLDDISLCKNWTLVDFYVDQGMSAPRMENAEEWCRLLGDCFSGKVDLIVTQKVTNVSSNPEEIAFIARILAAQNPPIGIYFVSDDLFTLASYYRNDLKDVNFLPENWNVLPDDELDFPMIYSKERAMLEEDDDEDSDEDEEVAVLCPS